MNTENKVISIAVGDRFQIEGVGTVELVVVAPEQPKIDKQEWLEAASRLFDSWMRISGGFVPKEEGGYFVKFDVEENRLYIDDYYNLINPFSFQSNQQAEQFIQENEKDLKTFFHQV